MAFTQMLYKIFIGPLELFFEVVFAMANRFVGKPGWAIVVLSLVVNFLVLPLYRRADSIQARQRDIENKLRDGVRHIKKTFRGDERMMILRTYYRQNNYKPTDALKGSVSLLLQVPFFIAAYKFLSDLRLLQGVPFGIIPDLGQPDGIVKIKDVAINLLPVVMTLVNIISGAIYLKGFPLKTKLQSYSMSLLFLFLLYDSPAGLVFYWTLNNIFSLAKNIFYRVHKKNRRFIISVLAYCVGVSLLFFSSVIYTCPYLKRKMLLFALGIGLQFPLALFLLGDKVNLKFVFANQKCDQKFFSLGTVFLTVLIGILIPSALLAASPSEFMDASYFHNPLWYLVSTFCFAAGAFLVWCRIFYWLSDNFFKAIWDKLMWIFSGMMFINYMFFATKLGIISSSLQYENGLQLGFRYKLFNFFVLMIFAGAMYFVLCKWKGILNTVFVTALISISGMSAVNICAIKNSVDDVKKYGLAVKDDAPHFSLSTSGKNVIVFMLDRAMGEYIPYIFNEKPELKKQFAGFTYYSNTISFGENTNFASPALFGGYEYTPVEMNKRDTEKLVSKHNEALKVMPVLFDKNGYDVTVCDPPLANYKWRPDLSIYDDYPDIKTYITQGAFSDVSMKEQQVKNNHRNFVCFSIMKTIPLFFQQTIYDGGHYNKMSTSSEIVYSNQKSISNSVAEGISNVFMERYNVLTNLPGITMVSKDEANTFLMFVNNTTHDPVLLQEPEYIPSMYVDNTEYDLEHTKRFTVDDRTLKMETWPQNIHYHANMAALIQLGKWFDYMRNNNVYDNTRIILAADHGPDGEWFKVCQLDDLIINGRSLEGFFPLLMVKDFHSEEFTTSNEFMTNADVPVLAMSDLISNPVNPFTGKSINNKRKNDNEEYYVVLRGAQVQRAWDTSINNGNTFFPAAWFVVKNDIWKKENWRYIDGPLTIPTEALQ